MQDEGSAQPQLSKKRLLIVENDQDMMDMINNALDGAFHILCAGSGEAAIAFLETAERVDVLLTDFTLGGSCDGLDVVLAVRERHPAAAITVMSGDSPQEPRIAEAIALSGTKFLPKPFKMEELLDALEVVR